MDLKRLSLFALPLLLLGAIGLVIHLNSEPLQATEQQTEGIPQWELPKSLREASGLAVVNETQLLVHNDEKGFIYRITLPGMLIEKMATLGDRRIKDDYEGIAIAGSDVYLTTSVGLLYRAPDLDLTVIDQTVQPEIIDTELGEVCEIEGLAIEGDRLLLPCKTAFSDEYTNQLIVFYYDIGEGTTGVHLAIPAGELGMKKVQPTAIEVTDTHYYIITERRLLVIDKETKEFRRYKLSKKRHFQPEGIALMEDGSLVIVDDLRKGIGRLTRYTGLEQLKLKE